MKNLKIKNMLCCLVLVFLVLVGVEFRSNINTPKNNEIMEDESRSAITVIDLKSGNMLFSNSSKNVEEDFNRNININSNSKEGIVNNKSRSGVTIVDIETGNVLFSTSSKESL